jgi:GT2 family glycosyltransferase
MTTLENQFSLPLTAPKSGSYPLNPEKYAITFACHNQVEYTRQCVESMIRHGLDLKRLVVVDNASTDETRTYLKTFPTGGLILNRSNLGCGIAWNQGALCLQAEWTVIMNNDVLVCSGWIENMIRTAESKGLKIISPAMVGGRLDYDFDSFANEAMLKTKDALRIGGRYAVCFAVHQSVWSEIGYFQPLPKLLGYEDALFFNEVDKANIATGITGNAWLYHFGSMTQTALKQELGLSRKQGLGDRRTYLQLLQQGWLERRMRKMRRRAQAKQWLRHEIARYGMSLLGIRENGKFRWK